MSREKISPLFAYIKHAVECLITGSIIEVENAGKTFKVKLLTHPRKDIGTHPPVFYADALDPQGRRILCKHVNKKWTIKR